MGLRPTETDETGCPTSRRFCETWEFRRSEALAIASESNRGVERSLPAHLRPSPRREFLSLGSGSNRLSSRASVPCAASACTERALRSIATGWRRMGIRANRAMRRALCDTITARLARFLIELPTTNNSRVTLLLSTDIVIHSFAITRQGALAR